MATADSPDAASQQHVPVTSVPSTPSRFPLGRIPPCRLGVAHDLNARNWGQRREWRALVLAHLIHNVNVPLSMLTAKKGTEPTGAVVGGAIAMSTQPHLHIAVGERVAMCAARAGPSRGVSIQCTLAAPGGKALLVAEVQMVLLPVCAAKKAAPAFDAAKLSSLFAALMVSTQSVPHVYEIAALVLRAVRCLTRLTPRFPKTRLPRAHLTSIVQTAKERIPLCARPTTKLDPPRRRTLPAPRLLTRRSGPMGDPRGIAARCLAWQVSAAHDGLRASGFAYVEQPCVFDQLLRRATQGG